MNPILEWLAWIGGMFLVCVVFWFSTTPAVRYVEEEEPDPAPDVPQWKLDLDKY